MTGRVRARRSSFVKPMMIGRKRNIEDGSASMIMHACEKGRPGENRTAPWANE